MPDEMNQQPLQQPATPQEMPPQAPAAQVSKGTSGLGITSLVLGILAILTSFLPIINNGAFILALLGLVFGIAGIISTRKGKKGGKGIAIAGTILNILSLIIVLATQSMYSAAIDEAVDELENGPQPVASTSNATEADQATQTTQEETAASEPANDEQETTESEQEATPAADDVDYQNLPVGQAVDLQNGLSVVVNSVETGLSNYDGDPVTGINVTYTNNGTENNSFNPFDWKALDTNGVLDGETFYMDGENQLSSGELTPGGSTSGNVYFSGEITNVYYYDNIFQSNASAGWAL